MTHREKNTLIENVLEELIEREGKAVTALLHFSDVDGRL